MRVLLLEETESDAHLIESELSRAGMRVVTERVDTKDAEMIADAVLKVEARYPALIGGIGIYKACCGHGPFTHVDVRGYRARW